tara:strand:+ start:6583 stop:6825 length:243 start_codon:yes stop_codon:yes gene_type:complete
MFANVLFFDCGGGEPDDDPFCLGTMADIGACAAFGVTEVDDDVPFEAFLFVLFGLFLDAVIENPSIESNDSVDFCLRRFG